LTQTATTAEGAHGIVDFHNHVLAAVDDGASSDDESHAALRAFAAAGATAVIATPHVDASLADAPARLDARLRAIDTAYGQLQEWAVGSLPELRFEVGAEVRLDTPAPELDDGRLRLAGGRFALVEFPFMGLPPNAERALEHIVQRGYRPIVAHPERYSGFAADLSTAQRWKDAGALLQVNGGSLLGRYGEQAQGAARALLEHGLIDYLCSDYHARGALPITAYVEWLRAAGGTKQAELLTEVNPARLLSAAEPLPVPPLVAGDTGLWHGLAARLRSLRARL
jgi:protein-tyrosine phosphatase